MGLCFKVGVYLFFVARKSWSSRHHLFKAPGHDKFVTTFCCTVGPKGQRQPRAGAGEIPWLGTGLSQSPVSMLLPEAAALSLCITLLKV